MTKYFSDLSKTRKEWALLFCGLSCVGLLAFVVLTVSKSEKTNYSVVASGLLNEDAATAIQSLREKKIPFNVDASGGGISVPKDKVASAKAVLATLKSGRNAIVGYEVFDHQSLGTTTFVQKLNQKRAREGELMRTINSIRGVKSSRVHLAVPEKSLFLEDRKRPTASVVLDFEDAAKPTQKQIFGIASLISRAIEGLEPGDIAIVDSNGKILWGSEAESLSEGPSVEAESEVSSVLPEGSPSSASEASGKKPEVPRMSNNWQAYFAQAHVGLLGALVVVLVLGFSLFYRKRASQSLSAPTSSQESRPPTAVRSSDLQSSLNEIRSGVMGYVQEDTQKAALVLSSWVGQSRPTESVSPVDSKRGVHCEL